MKTDKKMKSALSLLFCLVCVVIVSVAAYAYTTSTGVVITNTATITVEDGVEVNITSNDARTEIVTDMPDGGGSGSSHHERPTIEATTETMSEVSTESSEPETAVSEPETAAPDEENTDNVFKDVVDHWAEQYIEELRTLGIVNGVTDTLYYPNASTKRGDFAVVLDRLLDIDTGNVSFSDVKPDSYYAQAISDCAAAGIYIGYGDGTFKPEQVLSREEMMVIVAKLISGGALDYKDSYPSLNKFIDGSSVSWWSAPYVDYLASTDFVVGDNGYIRPQYNITRAEMAVIIYNYIIKS